MPTFKQENAERVIEMTRKRRVALGLEPDSLPEPEESSEDEFAEEDDIED